MTPEHPTPAPAAGVLVLVLVLLGPAAAGSDQGPQPPCGEPPQPGYALPGDPPNVLSWTGGELSRDWRAPACIRWAAPGFEVLVAVAGSFHHDGDSSELLARFGAISALTGVRYWSVTERGWRQLVTSASALSGPGPDQKRADFSAAELATGQSLYFVQDDNRSSGETVYHLRVLEAGPDRLVVESENATAVRMLILPLFRPGELQTVYLLERQSPGTWNFYSLSRTRRGARTPGGAYTASYVNRAIASFRYIAGTGADPSSDPTYPDAP